jgi:hypothetical protein
VLVPQENKSVTSLHEFPLGSVLLRILMLFCAISRFPAYIFAHEESLTKLMPISVCIELARLTSPSAGFDDYTSKKPVDLTASHRSNYHFKMDASNQGNQAAEAILTAYSVDFAPMFH